MENENKALKIHHVSMEDLENWNSINSDGSVTTAILADGSVTTPKLADLAVTTGKIADRAITSIKLSTEIAIQALPNGGVALGGFNEPVGEHAVVIGCSARGTASGNRSIAIGCIPSSTHDYSSVYSAGNNGCRSTAARQFMMGGTSATPTAYSAVTIISDERDKTDISDLKYDALDFINRIKPAQYKLNFREDYRILEEITEDEFTTLDDYEKVHRIHEIPVYEIDHLVEYVVVDCDCGIEHDRPVTIKTVQCTNRNEAIEQYRDLRAKQKDVTVEMLSDHFIDEHTKVIRKIKIYSRELLNDGSKARDRYHNGFIAQQVKQVADEMGFDFCGFKDHAINDGDDLYSLTYQEFVAPLVGAIQQLTKETELLTDQLEQLEKRLSALESK